MFQLNLSFSMENNHLPKDLDQLLVSFLKASAQSFSQDFYEQLYKKDSSIMKTYTFSFYLPGARFSGNKVILSDNEFKLFFSSSSMEDTMRFYNGFLSMRLKNYPLNGNSMMLTSVAMQNLKEIKDSEVVIKMQSSLIARRHDSVTNKDQYFTCDDREFSEVVKENVKLYLERMGLPVTAERFSITPLKGKKIVTPVFGRNTDGSLGIYKLCGTTELLNLLYLAGIGSRRNSGHGKFEIIA